MLPAPAVAPVHSKTAKISGKQTAATEERTSDPDTEVGLPGREHQLIAACSKTKATSVIVAELARFKNMNSTLTNKRECACGHCCVDLLAQSISTLLPSNETNVRKQPQSALGSA